MKSVLRLLMLPAVAMLALFSLVAQARAIEPPSQPQSPLQAQPQAMSASPRAAVGVIVKFKDPGRQAKSLSSILRLQASVMPTEDARRLRARVEALKVRHRLPAMQHKPTAFAAQLIHAGRPTTLAEAQAMAARLRADPEVEWAVPNELLQTTSATVTGQTVSLTPSEYAAQPWLQSRADAPTREGYANFPPAWNLLANKPLHPVVVAVLDTGILPLADLAGRIFPGYDFVSEADYSRDGNGLDADPRDEGDWLSASEELDRTRYPEPCKAQPSRWHGLAVTNMLAALPGNNLKGGVGILSPLPNEVVLPVRVAGTCGASTSDIIEGMLWAAGIDYQGAPARNVYPARVVNISLGGAGDCASNDMRSADWIYRQTVARLANKGVLVVAAAGNGDNDTKIGFANLSRPASCEGVLAVTGLNAHGYKAVYSNLANSRTVGGDVTRLKSHALSAASGEASDGGIGSVVNAGTTTPTNDYDLADMTGTSFAAPMVSGVAALMLAVDPSLTVDELRDVLSDTDHDNGVLDKYRDDLGRQNCAPDSATTRGNCDCTIKTCGAGILNAEKAITWAQARTAGASAYKDDAEYASEFTPDRLKPAPTSGGGGGGALDALALLSLGAAWCGARLLRRYQGYQVVRADRP